MLKVFHVIDLAYVFHRAEPRGFLHPKKFNAADVALASFIGDLWAKFVRGELDEESWPVYGGDDKETIMTFGDDRKPTITIGSRYKSDICSFWNTTYPKYDIRFRIFD
jgi:carboxylesterase type B